MAQRDQHGRGTTCVCSWCCPRAEICPREEVQPPVHLCFTVTLLAHLSAYSRACDNRNCEGESTKCLCLSPSPDTVEPAGMASQCPTQPPAAALSISKWKSVSQSLLQLLWDSDTSKPSLWTASFLVNPAQTLLRHREQDREPGPDPQ